MKMLQKQIISKLPETKFTKKDLSSLFEDGYEPFAEKNARAKKKLANIKLPFH